MGLKKGICIGFVVLVCATAVYGLSPWTHVCRDKFCRKINKNEIGQGEEGTALTVCKLRCGDDGNLWPLPTGDTSLGKTITPFLLTNINFNYTQTPAHSQWLTEISETFMDNLKKMDPNDPIPSSDNEIHATGDNLVEVTFQIEDNSQELGLETDESYTLAVTSAVTGSVAQVNVSINAKTYFGARHGLETLSQLVAYDEDNTCYQILNTVQISDKPVFSYRGIMLDTSRNFIPIPRLQKLVDAMSYSKLNMFHLHLTDTHSFPLQSTEPRMTEYGAYSSRKIYKTQELKDLVSYAKKRGVKIVAEFDAPAHVGNGWQWGENDSDFGRLVVCENQEPWYEFCVEPPCGQLNLANDKIYTVLESVYSDYMNIFDKDLFHMGGDEVHLGCYNSSTEITEYMTGRGIQRDEDGFVKLWDEFQTRARNLAIQTSTNANLTAIMWTSLLTSQKYVQQYVNNQNYIIQLWSSSDDDIIPFLINNGYRTIFSNYDAMYLDCGYQAWIGNGHNWCSPYKGWQTIYDHSPFKIYAATAGEEAAQAAIDNKLILGGETPLWMEQADEQTFEGKVWPRASALAERLWTNPMKTTWFDAERRMVDNRQRLVERGIQADRLQPEWCYQNENQCPGPPAPEEVLTTTESSGSTTEGSTTEGGATALALTPVYIAIGLISVTLTRM